MVSPGRPTDYCQLVLDPQGRAVGEISFQRFDLLARCAELNVKIAAWERAKGYGTAAVRQFLLIFFDEFGGRELVDDVALENRGGQMLLENLGFEHDPSVQGVYGVRLTRGRYASLYTPKDG